MIADQGLLCCSLTASNPMPDAGIPGHAFANSLNPAYVPPRTTDVRIIARRPLTCRWSTPRTAPEFTGALLGIPSDVEFNLRRRGRREHLRLCDPGPAQRTRQGLDVLGPMPAEAADARYPTFGVHPI